MRRYLVFISLTIMLLASVKAFAGDDSKQYNALIEMPKGSVSGICMLVQEGDTIKGAIVNEFGITAMDFYYLRSTDKVKLEHIIAMLDKWYIKKVLRKDLRELIHALKQGEYVYVNKRHHITYTLTPIAD